MKKFSKAKLCCIILLFALVFQAFPLFVFAEEANNADVENEENNVIEDGDIEPDIESEIDYTNAIAVQSSDELETALTEGCSAIKIDADFILDRTFYITKSTVIIADTAHTLKRASDFGGDIFVVGESNNGNVTESPVVLTVGKPDDATPSLITIDGNVENMTTEVIGSVFFVSSGSRINLYHNLTVIGHKKTGNERTLNAEYALSYPVRIGGAVAIISSNASMRIFGGSYLNNQVNDIIDDTTDEGMRSSQGGVIYNYGTLDVYGGRFEGNHAARAGVFYNYRTLNLYSAEIVNNTASSLGGAIYVPASTAAYLYIGEENDVTDSQVLFENNSSESSGGAIYAQHVATIKNTEFKNNISKTGHGGAIAAVTISLDVKDSVFDFNTALNGYGGAIYFSNTTDSDEKDLYISHTNIANNSSKYGGAIYLNKKAKTYFSNITLENNSASKNAGAIYATEEGTLIEINSASINENVAQEKGGAIYINSGAFALLNNIEATKNQSSQGGFAYLTEAELTLYDSTLKENLAATGGAINAQSGAVLNAYNVKFIGNEASSTQGGAIMLYTNETESILHSCVFENNKAANFGGGIYISSKSHLNMYNITANENSALKGGFMYETTTGTIVTLVGTTVSNNTSIEGGDIIWGNSAGAKLYIDKLKYVDNSYSGNWDDTYWAEAIYNSLTVYDIRENIPPYVAYGTGETVEPPVPQSITEVKNAAELERALEVGYTIIRIAADFEIDRTFFVTTNVTIYAAQERILKRASNFGGDIFVVGMNKNGDRVDNVVFSLGKTDSTDAMLTIDGNSSSIAVNVVGTVILVTNGSKADLGTKLCISNHVKTGNERILNGFSVSSYPEQVGGAVAIIEQGGEMNIYGGSYLNNSSSVESGVSYGGAFFNHSKLNIYGGVFKGNSAGRGGAFYNYRTMWIYGGEITENSALTLGGAIYTPNTTAAYLYICDSETHTVSKVYFTNNTAVDGGGAIYARNLLLITNTIFENNSATNGNGGAIYAGETRITLENCVFRGNTSVKYGGAIYLTGTNKIPETQELVSRNCTFVQNTATSRGGVCYVSGAARAYFTDASFTDNSSTSGGVFYISGASIEINTAEIKNNESIGSGGVLYLTSTETQSSDFIANKLNVSSNTAETYGGFAYLKGFVDINAKVEIYNSEFTQNVAKTSGGVAYASAETVWKSYNTIFKDNSATSSGGALFIYTNGTESLIHSCTFEGNTSEGTGGGLYVSKSSLLDMYNTKAIGNSSAKGGFMYETTSGTIVNLVGITLSGNMATEGGSIIWGNTFNAKLNIDKSQYRDLDTTGTLDEAYWSTAIYNKLTVNEISKAIPKYLDYRNESYDEMSDAIDVSNAEELEYAILSGSKHIRIISDILVDRTFYITDDVTIFTTIGHTLTRAPLFAGDMFVVGEDADGNSSLLMGHNAKLTLGNPYSVSENFLIIDGNKDNMLLDVVGSVIFISNSATVNLHKNVTVRNCHKVGNERSENEKYRLSISNRIGGTMAVVASGTLNIYGGNYKNNSINEEFINENSEEGRISTVGGLIFNYSNLNIYGGVFENNQAARGGVIYNYRITRIYGGKFVSNVATVSGGVYYAPNSAQVHLYIGSAQENAERVSFENNSARNSGGVIYASTLTANVIYGNASFTGNVATNGSGGAICMYGQLTVRDSIFENNVASSRGGAIYASNSSLDDVTRFIEITRCDFNNNCATLGGAISLYASSADYPEGAIANVTDSSFIGNFATTEVANASAANGGAVYLDRKAFIKVQNCTLSSNEASTEGGAFFFAGESKAEILNSNISENKAGKFGGAISVRSSYLTVDGAKILQNKSLSNGGAIYVSYQSNRDINTNLTVNNTEFTSNVSDSKGGAIYVTRRDIADAWKILTVTNSDFTSNTAMLGGGALYTVMGVSGYFENVSFTKNTVTDPSSQGGAVYAYGSILEFNGGTFTENIAVSSGGAISANENSKLVLHEITASNNEGENAGFAYVLKSQVDIYDSKIEENISSKNAGAIYASTGASLNAYNTIFAKNTCELNGGALMIYTDGSKSILQNCTFIENATLGNGGAMYISKSSIIEVYNVAATGNSAQKGGFMYITTTGTQATLVGATVSGNSAAEGGSIIWGNSTGAKLLINKTAFTDCDYSDALDDAYWSSAIYNLLTVESTKISAPSYKDYVAPVVIKKDPAVKPAGPVDEIFELANSSGSEYINSKYDNLPVLDNSSNFMSDGTTYFENINGGTVTVDSFVYDTNAADGNCTVGEGLLIYQAMLYKKAHPEEDVNIHLSAYRLSIEAAVNINRNSRYFGYMRNLGDKEYDENGFVRLSYLLVCAARMGIKVTVIGHIDGYPRTSGAPSLHKYFTDYLNTECDPSYTNGKVGDYMNFAECFWTLTGKGGTDMMHTKLCAVSHYIDINNVEHKNAVWTSSSNLDGISSSGINGNYKLQTATIVSDHEYIYRVSTNYLNLIADYCGQEQIYEFQDMMSRIGAEQIELILSGKMQEIPKDELLVYLGTEDDKVFELYFTPFAGPTTVWDEQNNPYCKYIREMYNSEDSIIFIWNAAEYNSEFPLGDQIEDIIVGSFYNNKNVENKFFGTMENFDKTKLDGLTIGVDIGYISVNKRPFGAVHNKDILLSYVKDGQRYYVSLLNSCNMHSGSMCYQSNFMLVIKETDCEEDSVFFTMADLSTTGIVEHTYGEETFYIPENDSHGYYYLPCIYCDKQLITGTIHRAGEWIIDREATINVTEIAHKACTDCGCILETRETVLDAEELFKDLTEEKGISFTPSTMLDTGVNTMPATFEAFIQLDSIGAERGGVIISNYSDKGEYLISIEVYTYGRIRLYVRNGGMVSECFFDTAITTTNLTHIAITIDENIATLYLNGAVADTKKFSRPFPTALDGTLIVGNDRRHKNTQYFKGKIYSAALFENIRTAEEIKRDSIAVSADALGLLYSRSYSSLENGKAITDEMGITFTDKNAISLEKITKTPLTIEAIIALPKNFSARGGVIFGNYVNAKGHQLNLEIYSSGVPRLYINDGTTAYTYLFNADIRSDGAIHMALVINERIATLYIAGKEVDSVVIDCDLPMDMSNFVVGGDNRADNSQYFKGKIYAIALYNKPKSAEEISRDAILMDSECEELLYLNYYAEKEEEAAPAYGASFGSNTSETVEKLSSVPLTFEATVRVPKEERNRVGIILGNYDGSTADQINLEIFPKGKVRLYFKSGSVKSQYVFNTDIRSADPVHLAVTLDGRLASLYVNGELKETATMEIDVPNATEGFMIGGDRREGNEYFFRGEIFSVYFFSDVRSAEEIMADYLTAPTNEDSLIYSKNFVTVSEKDEASKLRPTGQTFAENILQYVNEVTTTPYTFEAVFSVPTGMEGRIGTLVGNYDGSDGPQVNLEVYSRGQLRLFYTNNGERINCVFKVDLRTGAPIHIALTIDGLTATLYINGEYSQTKILPVALPEITSGYMIGGDHRYYNSQYFKGTLYSVALFADVRSAEEIQRDVTFVANDTDSLLYNVAYMKGICDPYSPGFVHINSEWIVDTEATDSTNGLKHKECLLCGKTLIIQEISSERTETTNNFADADGLSFKDESDAIVMEPLQAAPLTLEALVLLDLSYSQRAGVILGSYDGTSKNGLNIEIFTNGRIRLYYKVGGVGYSYVFSADVRSEWLTHIAVVIDGLNASLYVNGVLKDTLALTVAVPEITNDFRIGSDRRLSDGQYFKGKIYGIALFDRVRTAEEIALDAVLVSDSAEGLLYSHYYTNK